ncbi:MAG: FN3 associated domain-containing protein [bacterium]
MMQKQNKPRTQCFAKQLLLGLAMSCLLPATLAAKESDSAERQQIWEKRNSPQAIEAVAKDFLDLVILDNGQLRANNLFSRTSLIQIDGLVKAKKYAEALAAFEAYFFGKLRDPQRYGLSPADLNPAGEGVAGFGLFPVRPFGPEPEMKKANDLLEGILDGQAIGRPGSVNWLYPFKTLEELNPAEPKGLPATALLNGTAFNALVKAYMATGDQKYLKAWVAYMDDWALNSSVTRTFPHPCLVPVGFWGDLTVMVRLLSGLAQSMPQQRQAELLPPATLARILAKYWNEMVLYHALYLRTNTHNWTPSSSGLLVSMIFDEFKAAPLIFRESRRRCIEDNAVTQNLRDGSENQQCPWYNHNYEHGVGQLPPLFEARRRLPTWGDPPWVLEVREDADWFQEIREHLVERVGYQLRLLSPQGCWPVGVRGRDKRRGGSDQFLLVPEAFADPENRRLVAAVEDATRPANERSLTPDSGMRPTYHSEWFPYGGYNIVREGWEAQSGYGALFCSPAPGAYGGRRSRSNNNFFGLSAFGQDLVVEDAFGAYQLMGTPITVDGLSQDFHAGLTRVPAIAGHKMTPAVAWTDPAYWRWHASDRFNLMEGVYTGPYAKTDSTQYNAPNVPVTMQRGSVPLDQTLRGMRHQRWVHFVREAQLWIVTDRLRGEGEHTYSQNWYLPLKPGSDHAFTQEEIEVNPEARRIRTASTNATDVRGVKVAQANVSLHSFCKSAVNYLGKAKPQGKNDHTPFGQYHVALGWKGTGDSLMVTAIYPRAPGLGIEADIQPKQLEGPNGALGFEVALPKGGKAQYLAAPGDVPVMLELGGVRIEGESLLVTDKGGVAMGCRSFARNGKTVPVAHPDFEFSSLNPLFTPIYRPIAPVEIGPARNVFIDSIEVTMTSKTSGVEIRYTLDGSEPTPASTLYVKPFTLDRKAIVKARAYRPGVTKNPPQNSGTLATAVSRAVFDKAFAIKPVIVKTPQPGLKARYFEDDWRKLWLRLDSLTPQAEKAGVGVFDLSVVPESNPSLGKAQAPRAKFFAVEYTGYLTVPTTGVYTLHAPREYVMPDIDQGYELRIFLGQRIVPYAYRTQAIGLNEWYPSTRLHAQGNWSVALEKGTHPIRITYVDYRTDAPARLNQKGLNDYVWSGVTPDVRISGPGLEKQPIPTAWLVSGK